MRREVQPGDKVVVTLGGVIHEFGPDRLKVSVDQTSTRGNERTYRYATVVIDLSGGEFPEVPDAS